MKITLKDLLEKQIFKDYSILCAENQIELEVDSVSILETPDFENYIIEKSLILTTFYPIKQEVSLTKRLLKTLHERQTAGLIVKVHRYIDEFPKEIIELSNQLGIPIVTLNYDANLSLLFNNILSEIQMRDYANYAIDDNYSSVLQQVYESPTTKTLMNTVEHIDDLELLIENLSSKTIYSSSDLIKEYYLKFRNTNNVIQRIDDMIYYSDNVEYDNHAIYKIAFLAKNDRRHIIHNYIEIFKLMVVVIHQKKLELSFKQNEFLFNFVSNFAKSYTKEELLEATKKYKWNISFPLVLVLLTANNKDTSIGAQQFVDYCRTVFVNKMHVSAHELRYATISDQLLFIINIQPEKQYDTIFQNIHNIIKTQFPSYNLKMTYSDPIHQIKEITERYHTISEAFSNVTQYNIPLSLFNEKNIAFFNLMRNIDYRDLDKYIHRVLGPLIQYDVDQEKSLIKTLLSYFQCQFNVKRTAEDLFIHYNTVRYRLQLIQQLGYDVVGESQAHFELYFALYLYSRFYRFGSS